MEHPSSIAAPQFRLEDTLERLDRLHVFPDAATRIHEVVRDPDSSIQDLERAVTMDPSLSARILKVANSPFYGLARNVRTIGRAVQILGFYPTRDLAIALSVGAMGQRSSTQGRVAWAHSVAVAVASRQLARVTRGVDRNQAFISGLLHDVGVLVLLTLEPNAYGPLYERFHTKGAAMVKGERFHFGYDHAELGAACLRRWELPEVICLVVEEHHRPPLVDERADRLLATVVLADEMATRMDGLSPEDLAELAYRHELNRILRVPREHLEGLTGRLEEDVAHMVRLF